MTRILSLDVGHTTGLYQGMLLTMEPFLFYINSASIEYPLDEMQQKQLSKAVRIADFIVVEYPVINRISTLQKKTREVTNWWLSFLTHHSEIYVVQPNQWKPMQKLAPMGEILPELDGTHTDHVRDAARMAWWWSRQRIKNKVE